MRESSTRHAPWALVLTVALAAPAGARQGGAPPTVRLALPPLDLVAELAFPPSDAGTLLAEDARDAEAGRIPLRFAAALDVSLTPEQAGTWLDLPDGSRSWRLRVFSPGATDLGFGFPRFRLPDGAALWIVAEADGSWEGPYTAADNEEHGQLWTPVVPGDRAVLELFVPAGADFEPVIELGRVGHGYRDLLGLLEEIRPKSGACNNDVACPEGDPWRDEIRSVAQYTIGATRLCTGTLLQDVPCSGRPWFITAWHCLNPGDAPSLTFYWNYEATVCDGPRDGRRDHAQTGSIFRATWAPTDLYLVELDDPPDAAFNVFFSGWDRSDLVPNGSVGIHHPSTDEKAISFNDDALTKIDNCIGPGGDTHWRVNDWEDGTTEGGSSGSGLWDIDTKLLVGTLSGGTARCPDLMGWDCYGRLGVSWEGGGTPATRVRDWLDPDDTGALSVSGANPGSCLEIVDHVGTDACAAGAGDANGQWEPGEEVEIAITLRSGSALTNVAGSLSSSTMGVNVIDGVATWPDLAAGVDTESDAPHFRVSLDPDVPCGTVLDFTLTVMATGFGPSDVRFSHLVGEILAPDVPQPVAAGATARSDLLVTRSVTLGDVDVRVAIDHTWVGDLTVRLRAPSGMEVTLLDRPGFPALAEGCGDDDLDVTFDDAEAFVLEDHCPNLTPWYSGRALPAQSLSLLNGEDSAGTWTLLVDDAAFPDNGMLLDWELLTSPPVVEPCTACTADCPGQAFADRELRVTKGGGDDIVLTFPDPPSACAQGFQVWRAATARPGVGEGTFPGDPFAANVTGDDPGPIPFVHDPGPGTWYYLVVENLPGDLPGPSGHYGR